MSVTSRRSAPSASCAPTGIPGVAVCSGSAEVTELAAACDLVVDGPAGVVALLGWLAARLELTAPGLAGPAAGRAAGSAERTELIGEPLAGRQGAAGLGQGRAAPVALGGAAWSAPWYMADAVAVTSYGLTTSASWPSSAQAPASLDSTSAQPRPDTIGPSLATRFIPSRMGLTTITSATR